MGTIDAKSLLCGDVLVYAPSGFFGWVTAVKTWCKTAGHVEVYAGNNMSVASRNGIGVNLYPLRKEGLSWVLRPKQLTATGWLDGMTWFRQRAQGQPYDWKGLLCFSLAISQGAPDKMFCSEFAHRLLDQCHCPCFAEHWDADETAPATFLVPPESVLGVVWKA